MALIFFGTPSFAVPTLQALIDHGEEIALVVTQPDRKKGRGHVLAAPPVKELALSRGIPVLQPPTIRDESFAAEIGAIGPEFIVVVAYGRILPGPVLTIPRRGCINVHASLLPLYRGAAPVQWALLKGETITGVTTMLMDEGLDRGDMLLQATLDISDGDTTATLSVRLAELGARTLIETLRGIRDGALKPVPQQGEPSYAPSLRKDEGRIDWTRGARELFNFVRGMYPWPCAYCFLGEERIRIIRAHPLAGTGVPGRIEKASRGELIAGTGEGLLGIDELQPEGKRVMTAAAFLAGRGLREGHEKFS